jgi:hypothetical protein
MERHYGAPWGRSLRWMSLASVAVLLLIMILGAAVGPRELLLWWIAMVVLPLAVLVLALPFVVRSYTLNDRELIVHRLGHRTVIPLSALTAVDGRPDALRGSLRVFGNGGLFSITGWFWNRELGRYRAFVTDPDRAVVLSFADRRVVVSPHDPQAFIVQLRRHLGLGVPDGQTWNRAE